MIKYHFKLAIRYILKNKYISSIKVIGLTLGLSFFILGFLYVQDELKYDKHFKNTEQIYRLTGNNFNGTEYIGTQPARFLPEIVINIPEIESGLRMSDEEFTVKVNKDVFLENECMMVDSNFFDFFEWPIIIGSSNLEALYKCLVSECTAKKYFGNKSPIGEKLGIDNEYEVEIIGVYKDFPVQSHIKANIIISLNTKKEINSHFLEHWGNFGSRTYLKINRETDAIQIDKKLTKLWNKVNTSGNGKTGDHVELILQKFGNIYLRSKYLSSNDKFGDILVLKGVAIVSFIILLIGLVNYILLTISQLSNRAFEVGIKKTIGASSIIISRQLLVESLILVLISVVITFNLISLVKPNINSFLGKEFTLSLFYNFEFYLILLALMFLIIVIVNLSPRIYFSRIKPIQVLRLKRANTKLANTVGEKIQIWIKNSLIVFQFGLTTFLIIILLIVNKQLKLVLRKDYGFSRDQVVVINNPWDDDVNKRYNIFKENLLKFPSIKFISGAINVPTDRIWNWGYPALAENKDIWAADVGFVSVDFDYFKCLEAKIIKGRDFDQSFATDTLTVIINESLAEKLGGGDLVGKKITNLWDDVDREIIGIVKDIDFYTGQRPIKDIVFICHHRWLAYTRAILIKTNSENTYSTLDVIRTEWENAAPDWTFDHFFLDENFEMNYREELQTKIIINVLTLVAVMLSCLGLIGLSLHELQNRMKEIGIRKTNGAKTQQIVNMLLKLFGKWAVIAFVIACPVAYHVMNKWLQNFTYKTSLSWWIFVLAGGIALVIALLTVSWQSWRTARRNPVEALRYE